MLPRCKNIERLLYKALEKPFCAPYATSPEQKPKDEFRVLNLRSVRGQLPPRRVLKKPDILPPRTTQMSETQDWGNVWPGPRSFHPAVVPLPVRQGYVEKGASPGKHANAELMKIPNFLHLTPPVIKRQCEALKQFCTQWPQNLHDDNCELHFPLEVSSSDYCHSSPSIREPLARIVSIKFKLQALKLNARAKDKFLRLVGDRYAEESDTVTIVADRCPLKKQNYDYAMYLITALYHESQNVEEWEKLKSEADMEYYIWENNASKASVETMFGKEAKEIASIDVYSQAVDKYMNEGESQQTVANYGAAVRQLLALPNLNKN